MLGFKNQLLTFGALFIFGGAGVSYVFHKAKDKGKIIWYSHTINRLEHKLHKCYNLGNEDTLSNCLYKANRKWFNFRKRRHERKCHKKYENKTEK